METAYTLFEVFIETHNLDYVFRNALLAFMCLLIACFIFHDYFEKVNAPKLAIESVAFVGLISVVVISVSFLGMLVVIR